MTFAEILRKMGGTTEIGREMKVSKSLADYWIKVDYVPDRYWARLIRVCRRKGIKGVTASFLASLVDIGEG